MGIQVYTATHNGEGNPLSVMEKHFISFSYGGKNIEDFNLLSVTTNDRISRAVSSSFQNITTQYAGLDGQAFWLSTYDPLRLTFTLATDGITEKDIENFKRHFRPGIEKELILSEHPNRYIMARVEAVPSYSFLPFQKKDTIKFGENNLEITTTEYKGEVNITFVADEPFWYSKIGIINQEIDTASKEELKIYLEDGVPFAQLNTEGLLIYFQESGQIIEEFTSDSEVFLYNPSSAIVRPKISFTFEPKIEDNFIAFPANKISSSFIQYSSISIGSSLFEYTLPSVLNAFNQAIKIANDFVKNGESSIVDLMFKIREGVLHRLVRAKAIEILTSWNVANSENVDFITGKLKSGWEDNFATLLLSYIPKKIAATFDSSNGEALITYIFNEKEITEKAGDMVKNKYLLIEDKSEVNPGQDFNKSNLLQIKTSDNLIDFSIHYKYTYL